MRAGVLVVEAVSLSLESELEMYDDAHSVWSMDVGVV